jgi:protein TonB
MARAIESEDWDTFRNLAAGELMRDLDEVQEGVPAIRSAGGIDSINIQKEDVTGDTATVLYEIEWRNGATEEYYMRMVKENGVWKVNNMSAIVPPEMPVITPPPPPPPLPDSANTNSSSTSIESSRNVNAGSKPPTPTIIRKSGGVLAGEATRRVEPPYPPLARAARVEGAVVVELTIDERGSVTSARALSGHPLLKDAAVNAARQWTFKPTVLSGTPVKVVGTITFNFKL